jgi:uncharacterized protein (DUF362 family)
VEARTGTGVTRRGFLQLGGAAAALTAAASAGSPLVWPSPGPYRVGVGRDLDAYAATVRAVLASEDWQALDLVGRKVVIKPNLVMPAPADQGGSTDPECVRALADLALAGGAAEVWVVESSPGSDNFSACGYDPLHGYGGGLVSLIDAQSLTRSLFPVPGGLTYDRLWQRDALLAPDVVFVSAAKLKLHLEAHVTLAMKNLVGLLPVEAYLPQDPFWPRWSMHHRGLHQAIVDMNLVRPIDFAVVEGIWGMEGLSPLWGTPVHAQTVLAGSNAVAVDRVAVHTMGLSQRVVKHLSYAARLGLGPTGLSEIELRGDALVPTTFRPRSTTPIIEYPRPFPAVFAPAAGQSTCLVGWYGEPCVRTVRVMRAYDDDPSVSTVRALAPAATRDPGFELLRWDGRADDGSLVAPGRYAVHVTANPVSGQGGLPPPAYAVGWVEVAHA